MGWWEFFFFFLRVLVEVKWEAALICHQVGVSAETERWGPAHPSLSLPLRRWLSWAGLGAVRRRL